MYEGLRLTELHEEIAHYSEAARRERGTRRDLLRHYVKERDAEIRARVAAQEIGPPYLRFPAEFQKRLVFGVPDAVRKYPGRYDHWSYHARHAVPVEGCHLCREGRR